LLRSDDAVPNQDFAQFFRQVGYAFPIRQVSMRTSMGPMP
jgi:hypothetical protein